MDDYEKLLVEYLKDGKISMDNYVQLNNVNLLNIKDNLQLVNKFDNLLKNEFNKRYSDMIKFKDNTNTKDNTDVVFKNKIIFNRLIKKSNLTYLIPIEIYPNDARNEESRSVPHEEGQEE